MTSIFNKIINIHAKTANTFKNSKLHNFIKELKKRYFALQRMKLITSPCS